MAGIDSEEFARLGGELGRRLAELLAQAAADTADAAPDAAEASHGSIASGLLAAIDVADAYIQRLRGHLAGGPPGAGGPAAAPASAWQSVIRGKGLLATLKLVLAQALNQPELLAKHYAGFAREALAILGGDSALGPQPGDFRFKDRLWQGSAALRTLLQLYLAWSRALEGWLADQDMDQMDRRRIGFLFRQLIAALAPSNLPVNPAALRRADATAGGSVVAGLKQLADDAVNHGAMPRQIRPDAYQIGHDIAVTPGAVIFRNPQLELIQYAPQTPAVRRRPVLLVPPQINKYYVFDLKRQNSLIGHLIGSGLQMFTLSWRNPTAAEADWGLDTYVGSVLEALDAIRAVTGSPTVGLISACAGGLTAMALIGYLTEGGDRRVRSHSLLVTCLFPNQGSDLELFATPAAMALTRAYVEKRRTMAGEELARVFFWLRPTDLVWRYWINNYLLGRQPPPLDVLFWDNDSTRLPAALHADFLTMFEQDVFHRPQALTVLGRPVDFGKVAVDHYVVGGEDDYLMPWTGCYHTCRLFRGRNRFVLSTSGHVQSILRPPRLAGTHYYTHGDTSLDPAEWRRHAARHDGSWWGHWHAWLNESSGALKAAPQQLGSADHPPLEPAPGSYVFG